MGGGGAYKRDFMVVGVAGSKHQVPLHASQLLVKSNVQ